MKYLLKKGLGMLTALTLLTGNGYALEKTQDTINSLPQTTNQQKEVADWTVMCYLNADNDLKWGIRRLFNLLEGEGTSDNMNILVLYDRPEEDKYYKGFLDTGKASDTSLLLMKKPKKNFKLNKDLSNLEDAYNYKILQNDIELDMGSPKTLEDFVKYSLKEYPSKKQMLIFSSHGYGTAGEIKNDKYGSFSPDETDKSILTLEETKTAIKNAIEQENQGKKLDMMVMMTCITNTLGTNYSFKDITSSLVGSTDRIQIIKSSEFSAHPTLDELIKKLKENPSIEKKELTKHFIDKSFDKYRHFSIQLSEINNDEIDNFMEHFKNFSDTLQEKLTDKSTRTKTTIMLMNSLSNMFGFARYPYYDLYDFLERIENTTEDSELKKSAHKTKNYLQEKVITYERHKFQGAKIYIDSKYFQKNSHGLSIYFPSQITEDKKRKELQEEREMYKKGFDKSELAKDTSWNEVAQLFIEEIQRMGLEEL